jgi:3-methyl-2-oxobutanoate hydroxymethyltransferase
MPAQTVVQLRFPTMLPSRVTSRLKIPTIGIGAGPHRDGQVLVSYDMLRLFDGFVPPFVKQYAQLSDIVLPAAKSYAEEVRVSGFPKSASTRNNGATAVEVIHFTPTRPR